LQLYNLTQTAAMPTIEINYVGDLRTEDTHLQSGTVIQTDAPTDNQGRGEAFSPTDLVANALGTCILTTMAIFARRDGIELVGSEATATKVMSSEAPRRIAKIEIAMTLRTQTADGVPITDAQKTKLEKIAHTCPVAISLHPDLEQAVRIEWES
jgi:putative redox protein